MRAFLCFIFLTVKEPTVVNKSHSFYMVICRTGKQFLPGDSWYQLSWYIHVTSNRPILIGMFDLCFIPYSRMFPSNECNQKLRRGLRKLTTIGKLPGDAAKLPGKGARGNEAALIGRD